jgi:isocitrate dehydrogenase kinase/phosphatase
METDLASAINRLATAHEKLAENVGRIADALSYVETKYEGLSFAEALVEKLRDTANAIDAVAEKMPEPPADD